jgi:hypothetical protein
MPAAATILGSTELALPAAPSQSRSSFPCQVSPRSAERLQ